MTAASFLHFPVVLFRKMRYTKGGIVPERWKGMEEILFRAAAYLCMIALGAVLKRVRVLGQDDFHTLSKVMLNITLPCAIVYNVARVDLEISLLAVTALSVGIGVGMVFLGAGLARLFGKKDEMAFDAVNFSGFNIGNFCMPFVQSFLPSIGVLAISLFDTGNSLICNGGSRAVGAVIQQRQRGGKADLPASLRTIGRTLLHSTPFMTYMVMLAVAILHVPVPAPVLSIANLGAQANPFVAMLMIGVGFKLSLSGEGLSHAVRLLVIRYALAGLLAAGVYCLLPFALEVRQALVLAVLSPIASANPPYTAALGEDYPLSCTVNSISMLLSIALLTGALLVML